MNKVHVECAVRGCWRPVRPLGATCEYHFAAAMIVFWSMASILGLVLMKVITNG